MNFSNHSEIVEKLIAKFGTELVVHNNLTDNQPSVEVLIDQVPEVCQYLKNTEGLYFDFLNSISAIDNGVEANTFELWYHMSSIVLEQSFIIKATIPRASEYNELAKAPSVSAVWKTADWHERECFDLMGIEFINHPDLRRILLPADWIGYPLRKDYVEQETYHGINVKYDR